jgi:tRNA modification GTPase
LAVVRVSGPAAGAALEALAAAIPEPRHAGLRRLSWKGAFLDQALVLWFPGPASFTGENVAEFHIHGGRAVREALSGALLELGLRPAEPGEFSRRAVENGRFDLTRAEAIADLAEAETPAQLRQALSQYEGALAQLYEAWRARLLQALARAEAAIDFSDDGVGETEFSAARRAAAGIAQDIERHVDDAGRGEALREGLRLAIIGPPNAGKSSLINALARRDIAIVSEIPGTTRDVVSVRLNLGGYPLHVSDTAGLRETRDAIEAEGVRRARAEAQSSHLTLLLLDGSDGGGKIPNDVKPDLVVWNKSDLPSFRQRAGLSLSLKNNHGFPELLDALKSLVEQRLENHSASPALTRPRHRHALTEALASLRHAQTAQAPELFAEDLRLAMRAIGRITGAVDVEEILDSVFRDFCIGK